MPATGPRLDGVAGIGIIARAGGRVDMGAVAGCEGRGDEAEEDEGEIEHVVHKIAAEALWWVSRSCTFQEGRESSQVGCKRRSGRRS